MLTIQIKEVASVTKFRALARGMNPFGSCLLCFCWPERRGNCQVCVPSLCAQSVPIDLMSHLRWFSRLVIPSLSASKTVKSEEKRIYYEKSGGLDGQKGRRVRWVKDIGRIPSIMNS